MANDAGGHGRPSTHHPGAGPEFICHANIQIIDTQIAIIYTQKERCESDSIPPSLMEVCATVAPKRQRRTQKNREKKCTISTLELVCLIGMQTILGAARAAFLIVISIPGGYCR